MNKKHQQHRNQVRIIGGSHRGRKLTFPQIEGLRPTADSVREKLFNWLGQDLTACDVLDLFAGSGAMGIEAASRHAKQIVMIENHKQAIAALQKNLQELQFNNIDLIYRDALTYLKSVNKQFDIVFLDPPYAWQQWSELLNLLIPHLKSNAQVYLESNYLPALPSGWQIRKQGKSGISQFVLLSYEPM